MGALRGLKAWHVQLMHTSNNNTSHDASLIDCCNIVWTNAETNERRMASILFVEVLRSVLQKIYVLPTPRVNVEVLEGPFLSFIRTPIVTRAHVPSRAPFIIHSSRFHSHTQHNKNVGRPRLVW